jgi:hypothetical protein
VSTASCPWGRVDEEGTVYVRTSAGERAVGSWQAGSPEEALAFFQRKFASLETEVALLEQRLATTDLSAGQAEAAISRLRTVVADARVVGDLDGLAARLDRLSGLVDRRREEQRAAREQARSEAMTIKERIVAEAERIAAEAEATLRASGSTHWKVSGERMRQLLEEWKAAPRGDRAAEAVLWKRFSAARNAFTKRRKAYFATLEEERESAKTRKEKLVAEAEGLASSTSWTVTAVAFRDLMRQWKQAGRADRVSEEKLWNRFRAAQDSFFRARAAALSAKEGELRAHAGVKTALLAEAEKLLPVTDCRAARVALRGIQERWEKAGPVPRAAHDRLEAGLRRVEEAVRAAEDSVWRRSSPEALRRARGTVEQIRSAIANLEGEIAEAQASGDEVARKRAEEALAARRSWLAEAERTLAELSR